MIEMPEIRYTTHNMYYAAYLVFMGFECVGVVPSTHKVGFYDFGFNWISDVKSFESEFFNRQAQVEPSDYIKIVSQLRDMLNKRKNEDLAQNPPVYK